MVATHAPSPEPATTAEMAETAFAEIFAAVIVNVILNPQSSQSLSLRSQVSHLQSSRPSYQLGVRRAKVKLQPTLKRNIQHQHKTN